MQRNIADQKTLTTLLALLAFLLVYPAMESVYPIFPPLIGIVYVQWRDALYRRDYFWMLAWMFYALILETVWNLPLYGIWAVMIAAFAVFDPKITHLLRTRTSIHIVSVVLFDLLYFSFVYGYGYVTHTKIVEPDLILFYYFLIDIVGVILF